MSPDELDEELSAKELAEANEITGAVKWEYTPFIHFPKGTQLVVVLPQVVESHWLESRRPFQQERDRYSPAGSG